MKIAFFSDCYLDLTGGIVSSINAQKVALESLGHTVYIFSTSYPKTDEKRRKLSEQHIYPVPSCRFVFRGLTPVSRRPKIVENWLLNNHPEIKNFDIYYVHYEGGCSIAGLRLGKKFNIPTIQVMHGREDMGVANIIPCGLRTFVATILNWFHSWYLPHLTKVKRDNYLANTLAKAKMWTLMVNHANYADLVIAPSKHFRKKLIQYGVTKPIEVLPNGFSDALFPSMVKIKKFNSNDELRMVWHSRVSREKRIISFLEALGKLKAKYRLDVYGDGNDLRRAARHIKKHHLNVYLHGNTSFKKLKNNIDSAHLDILVSHKSDTFGMTLIEAEAFATPVFFCDPDMEEIVPEGSFVLSKNETPEAMTESLNNLIKKPEKIEQMSEVMFKHREEVLISNRIKKLEKIFNDIINE